MLKKMIKTSAVALLLAGTTVGSITPAFAQIQTKDVTEKDFLEYIERLKKENPKLNIVEDEPVMYSSAKEAQAAYTEQLKSLKASDEEIKEKITQFEKLTKEYETAVEQYKQDKITFDELMRVYNEQKAQYDQQLAHIEELKKENEAKKAEHQAAVEQYNKDMAKYNADVEAYNAREKEIADKTALNEAAKKAWQAQVEAINKQNADKHAEWQAEVDRINDEHNAKVAKYEKQKNDFEEWLNSNPVLADLYAERGISIVGRYDDSAKYHAMGENTKYKEWWQYMTTVNPKYKALWDGGLDFNVYGGADTDAYFKNVFAMYDEELIYQNGYEYSKGNIGINPETTMEVTEKDPRVRVFDDQYGKNYEFKPANKTETGKFMSFVLHNIGTTESGKTISARVEASKWSSEKESATFTYRNGIMGGFGDGVRTTYHFFDEATGEPIKLVRYFYMDDTEAGEGQSLEAMTNGTPDKLRMIVPMSPSDKAAGVQEGTRGYPSITNTSDNAATYAGDQHMADLNMPRLEGQPNTYGNTKSTPLGTVIGVFAGDTIIDTWNGDGGALNFNSSTIEFKSKPGHPPVSPDGEIPEEPTPTPTPDEPTYNEIPERLEKPVKPEEPKAPELNTWVDPVEPTRPSVTEPSVPTNPAEEVKPLEVHYHRTLVAQYTTKWIDKETGKELKDPVTDEKTFEAGSIEKYSFVSTSVDEDGNVTHFFKQFTTKWVDKDGKELKPLSKNSTPEEHGEIENYVFDHTDRDENGNETHVFKQLKTKWVDPEGKDIKDPFTGGKIMEQGDIEGYVFKEKKVDEDGNVTYIFKQLLTRFVDENNNDILDMVKGNKFAEKQDIGGYTYLTTSVDKDHDTTTHVYHKLHTTWVEEGSNTLLKESDGAIEKPGEISSYEYVRTEKLENGDIVHFYKKATSPVEKPVEKVKEIISTGIEANPIASIMVTAGTLSAGLFAFFKKKKK